MAKGKNKGGKGKAGVSGAEPTTETTTAVLETPTTTATENTGTDTGTTTETVATPKLDVLPIQNATDKTAADYKLIDIRQIKSNVGQSRGAGVLYNLKQLGFRAFPGDPSPGKQDNGKVVLDELLSGDPERMAAMVKLMDEHEPDIRELAVAITNHTQLQPIVIRPVYGDDGAAVPDEWNVSAGARRTLARALTYADSNGKIAPTLDANVMGKLAAAKELEMALSENKDRKQQSPIDDALFFLKLKREHGLNPKQIAKEVYGYEEAYQTVTQRMQLLRGKPEEIQRCHEGKLGATRLLATIKDREGGNKNAEAKDKPGVGERGKVPSVAQVKEMLAAVKPSDMKEDTAERFGKGKTWEGLKTNEDFRKILASWAKVDYISYADLCEQKKKEREDAIKAQADAAKAKQNDDGE